MCLSIAIHRPDDVLETGYHRGFEYVIVHNGRGYRCGYVRVPKGHPWHGADYNDLNVDCHGGVTFVEEDEPCGKGGADDAYWVGFDCAHSGDAADPKLPLNRYEGATSLDLADLFNIGYRGTVRTQEYVREECKSICEQALAAGAPDKPTDLCEITQPRGCPTS